MRCRCQRGFTLLELMVSLIIIGIIVTYAVLSIGDPKPQRLQFAVDQFEALTRIALEQSLFNSEEIGIAVWRTGYDFVRLDAEGWIAITDSSVLKLRNFPEDIRPALFLEGIEVDLPIVAPETPQLFVQSSGELTPFELELTDQKNDHLTLVADVLGNLSIKEETEDAP